jgi:hypothetical protein
LNADLVRQYFNLDSDTFEGSPVSFLWEEGWLLLDVDEVV